MNDVVKTVVQNTYEKMNKNWSYGVLGSQAMTESKYWKTKTITICSYTTDYQPHKFDTLMLNCPPEDIIEALDDLINRPAIVECTIANRVAQFMCMRYIMGDMEFTAYAQAVYKGVNRHPDFSPDDFFLNFPNQFITKGNGKPIPGSIVYLTNLSSYILFKPQGSGHGNNLIYMGDNKYLGFGPLFLEAPQSSESIEMADFDSFCSQKDVEKNHARHALEANQFLMNKNEFKKQRDEYQRYKFNFFYYFDMKKFIEFIKNDRVLFHKKV